MYLWRRSASPRWLNANENKLSALAGERLAIIERANRERLQLEVAGKSRAELEKLARRFGGRIQKLPRNWLQRALRQRTNPIKVGNKRLRIPAGAAFGTGEHATTAMCLGFLARSFSIWGAQAARLQTPAARRSYSCSASRRTPQASGLRSPELVVDLGTGSGILALAAKLLGATRVIGIDNDPIAISTAKQNARLNKIRGVQFRAGDVRRWKFPRKVDIVTANLFSELLIELLPKLKTARSLILSGILRTQERDVKRALARNKIDIIDVRRRGKWVAMLARCG
jgi:ribosomal protein L11 methyltransferase